MPILPIDYLKRCGVKACGLLAMVLLPPRKLMMPFATVSACAGHKWDYSRPTVLPGARRAWNTLSHSSVQRLNGLGPN